MATPSALTAPVENWLARLRVERRLSPHTLTAYRRDLDLLLAFAAQKNLDHWKNLTPEKIGRAHV